jgi:membrane fusion protein, copper/silver efflux system
MHGRFTSTTVRAAGLGLSIALIATLSAGARAQAPAKPAPAVPATPAPANPTPSPVAATPNSAKKLVESYLVVQRKLAADDHKAAQSAFVQVKAVTGAPDLAGDAALKQRLAAAATAGAAAKDLDADRVAFGMLSEALLEWLKREGNPLAASVRVAHCPMAMNGKGARWLQTEAKVGNPFYGSEMLTCGSIERELAPGAKPK